MGVENSKFDRGVIASVEAGAPHVLSEQIDRCRERRVASGAHFAGEAIEVGGDAMELLAAVARGEGLAQPSVQGLGSHAEQECEIQSSHPIDRRTVSPSHCSRMMTS